MLQSKKFWPGGGEFPSSFGVSTKVKYSTDEFKSAQEYELTGGLPHHLTLACTLAAKEAMQKSESMTIYIS